jgi:CRISPR/Cas system CMR subunit Cmr6 (Cas7 group RAMP superfamily)
MMMRKSNRRRKKENRRMQAKENKNKRKNKQNKRVMMNITMRTKSHLLIWIANYYFYSLFSFHSLSAIMPFQQTSSQYS